MRNILVFSVNKVLKKNLCDSFMKENYFLKYDEVLVNTHSLFSTLTICKFFLLKKKSEPPDITINMRIIL